MTGEEANEEVFELVDRLRKYLSKEDYLDFLLSIKEDAETRIENESE